MASQRKYLTPKPRPRATTKATAKMPTDKLLNTAPEESRTNVVGRKRKQFSELPPPNKHVKLDDESDEGSSSSSEDDEVDIKSRAHSSSNSRESGEVSSESPDPSRLAKEAWQSDADSPRQKDLDSNDDSANEMGVSDDEGVVDLTGHSNAAKKPKSSSRSQQRAANGTQAKVPVKFTPKPAPQRNRYDELLCQRCSKTGHNADGCPTLWKSFFPVATVKKIPKADMVVSCYNCGVCSTYDGDRAAHWGDECPYLPAFLKDNPSGVWERKWAEQFVLGADKSGVGMTGGNGGWEGQRAAFYDGRD